MHEHVLDATASVEAVGMSAVADARSTPYSATEMMAVAAARLAPQRRRLLRRHRRAVAGLQPGAAHARARHHADLRVGHHRRAARRAAALDRRPRAVRDGADHGVGPRDVRLLAAGRPHLRRLPRRRADRPLRQHQLERDRPYDQPKVRLPGGGGAPEIAALCRQTYVVMAQTRRSFVERVDFITSFGFGEGGDHRQRLGIHTAGPDARDHRPLRHASRIPTTKELVVSALHPGVTREQVAANTGWPVRFAEPLDETPPPDRRRAVDAARLAGAHRSDAHARPGHPERAQRRPRHPERAQRVEGSAPGAAA